MKTENELIAEFMGYRLVTDHPEYDKWYTKHHIEHFFGYGVHELEYDKSWDWLMPVVEKIEEVALNVVIETACVRIDCFDDAYPEYHSVTTFESQDDTKLKVLYRAIVTYIRWYNSQNS